MNRNRNGQNRQTQDHSDGKIYENTTSDNETCALGIQKVFTFKKKSIKDGTKVFFCFVKEYDCL